MVTGDSHDCVLGFASKDIVDVVDYLKAIRVHDFSPEKCTRILLIALLLRERSVTLRSQYESLDEEQKLDFADVKIVGERIIYLIPELVFRWWKYDAESLRTSMLSDQIIQEGLVRALRCKDLNELRAMTPGKFLDRVFDPTT